MTIGYNPSSVTFYQVLWRWQGTLLPMVLYKPMFWFLALVHTAFICIHELVIPLPVLPYSAVGTIMSLLVFFVVFYGSQSYARLQMFWGHCVGLSGTTMNWVALVQTSLGQCDAGTKWNCTRYVVAALHVLYYTLNFSSGGSGVSSEEWSIIQTRGLLSEQERDIVVNFKGLKPFLLLVWALGEVESALGRDAKDARTAQLLGDFRKQAFDFRGHCGHIVNWLAQPVPYPYFHAAFFIMVPALIFLSYGLATLPETHFAIKIVLFLLVQTMMIGLLQVAIAMSDPFGDDIVDFDLEPMLTGTFNNMLNTLTQPKGEPGNALGAYVPQGVANPLADAAKDDAMVALAKVQAWAEKESNAAKSRWSVVAKAVKDLDVKKGGSPSKGVNVVAGALEQLNIVVKTDAVGSSSWNPSSSRTQDAL
jgi:predicted membrane chloride channel (bestrophin family)